MSQCNVTVQCHSRAVDSAHPSNPCRYNSTVVILLVLLVALLSLSCYNREKTAVINLQVSRVLVAAEV